MNRRTLVATVLLGITMGCAPGAQTQSAERAPMNGHPSVEVDVRQFGYERFVGRSARPLPISIDFTDSDHLAVAWLLPDGSQASRKDPPRVSEPAHMHLIVLDAETGQKQREMEWPTPYYPIPLFFGIPDGRLLTCTGDALHLLSTSLEVIRENELPNHGACASLTWRHSPSRRTLFLSIPSGARHQVRLLDSEALDVLSSWTEEQQIAAPVAISDHWLVGYCGSPLEPCSRKTDEPWYPFHPAGLDTEMSSRRRFSALFVSDEAVVIESGGGMTLATMQGAVVLQERLHKGHLFLLPAPSAASERFAIIEDRFRGIRSEPLDMYPFAANDRALVYSIPDRRKIFEVRLKGTSPWTPWDIHESQIALSPNGTLLAVLSDGLLRIWRLPNGF
jgi:hypothetical protein